MTLQEQIDLLGWKDITTDRQIRNGTRIYRLPIKKYGQFIEVGSFESGYVRRMNGCYTPYQLISVRTTIIFIKNLKLIIIKMVIIIKLLQVNTINTFVEDVY